ncbi:ATP-grasp domain-containing protein [Priestia megaterium]|uniref:ATP-grasp domain-containing protein n=1 Tax=Priestia megaterium TaxID=1404 RepID=UPI000BF94A2A|nr:ATP-grasp domain-containing protein [Priestia megaterium]MDH2453849.1 ATP-grasp domain-containing protein [Priestia megaterium]MDL5153306.1 ATP-grasp domain-containing protein [Priestia megaterium]PEW15574.1 carbamoyl-phosphate synthase small subunit [Priestia megaterium]PFJ45111.1 carbamoyl-phosphate synthase small subunit [Priestia megaterium]PGX78854.1 carbamoyl-phosphate synthase small subunit [Priestia megaterium]
MKKVLVLGVASVQLDAILELKKMGYETYACAMAKDGPGADAADHFDEINILDKPAIIQHIKNNNISLVYSVGSDLAMPVASFISEELSMPHFVSEETARICNNKDLMRKTLGNDFTGNVKFQVIEDENQEVKLNFPFILKPADSQGQRGVKLVTNSNEYLENYKIAKEYSRSGLVILEQYISGPELSVNGYMVDGELKYLIASDRETWSNYTGLIHKHIVPTTNLVPKMTEVLQGIIESACEKLNIVNGPVYAQIKLEEEMPYIIEITPRLDGCHMWNLLQYYTGVNLLKLTFEHLLNNDISELENHYSEYKNGYVLEFICQEPNTLADYTSHAKEIDESLESFNYYKPGDRIRPVNGKFDKIGYFIYQT